MSRSKLTFIAFGTGPALVGAAIAAVSLAAPAHAGDAGSIKGTVKLTGKAPKMESLKRDSDPFCKKTPMKDEEVVVSAKGGLKNVLVRIDKGLAGNFPAPAGDATINQEACMYRPRVMGVVAGQNLLIKNSDQTLHNVHTYKGANTVFNQAQPPGVPPFSKKLPGAAGTWIKFKCDVHNWMTAHVYVAANPFFAVSDGDGGFTIDKVPPGKYTLEAWHEKYGSKTAEVTVAADKPAEAVFDFAAK